MNVDWQCEKCGVPWRDGEDRCHQCGNRTRIPVDPREQAT